MTRSFLIQLTPNELGHVYLVYDTLHERKHIFTAVGVGRIKRGGAHVTQVAEHTLDALTAYAQRHASGRILQVEVATEAAAKIRVRKALEAANDKDAVFFVARSHLVCDAVFFALNVDATQPRTSQ